MAADATDWHWRGFLRPVWRDPVLWFAVFATASVFALQVLVFGWSATTAWSWAALGLRLVLTGLVVFAIVGTGAGVARGWERGLAEAARRRDRNR